VDAICHVGPENLQNGIGRDGEIRTRDPLHPMQVRYQAAPRPDWAEMLTPLRRLATLCIAMNGQMPTFEGSDARAFLSKNATKTSRKSRASALGCRSLHSKVSTRPTVSTKSPLARLTATQISTLRPGATKRDISDSAVPGLVLRIGVSGSKYWLLRFKLKGKTGRISLGAFPKVSLAQARAPAFENRQLLEKGIDPRRAKRAHRRQLADLALTQVRHVCRDAPQISPPQPYESLPPPAPEDKHSVEFLAYEYIEHYVRPNRESPSYAIRILRKDVLPEWKGPRRAGHRGPRSGRVTRQNS
jgi:hypothetical protein